MPGETLRPLTTTLNYLAQVRYGGKQELATEGSEEVQELLTRVELVLGHGMKEAGGAPSLGLAMMRWGCTHNPHITWSLQECQRHCESEGL